MSSDHFLVLSIRPLLGLFIIPANLLSRPPLSLRISGASANGATCMPSPRIAPITDVAFCRIIAAANCDPPNTAEKAGKNISIVINRSFHLSNNFEVPGSRYATKASGDKMVRITISACRAARTNNTTNTVTKRPSNSGTSEIRAALLTPE